MGFPTAKGLYAALETHNSNTDRRFFRRLAHQPPDTVVGDEVHQDFFTDHHRRQAAQDIQPHGYLDVSKKQLDIPPFKVKFGKLFGGISRGIKQGGDDVKPLSPETTIFHPDLDLSQNKLLRKSLPFFFEYDSLVV